MILALAAGRLIRAALVRWRYNRRERLAVAAWWSAMDGPWRVWLAEARVVALHERRTALVAQRQAVAR